MPAFSSTDAYQEAAGFPREYGAWNFQQFQEWLTRSVESGKISDELRSELIWHARNQIEQGYPAPDVIRDMAQQVVPGVEAALQRRQGRLDNIQQLFEGRIPTSETVGRIFNNINEGANDIVRGQEGNQREVDTAYQNIGGINDGTSGRIVDNIGETVRSLQGGVNDTFGGARSNNAATTGRIADRTGASYSGLRSGSRGEYDTLDSSNRSVTGDLIRNSDAAFERVGRLADDTFDTTRGELGSTISGLERGARDSSTDVVGRLGRTYSGLGEQTGSTYGRLGESAEDTYDETIAEAETLDPYGEAAQARTARSFAPAVAAAKGRLRARGVSSNDAQAQQIMGDVERNRARMMDDAASGAAESYVDRLNDLRIGRQGARERLGTGELETNIGLRTREQDSYERLQEQARATLERLGMTRYSESRDLNLAELSQAERTILNRELSRQGLSLTQLENQMNIARNRQQEESRLGENQLRTTNENERTGQGVETELAVGQSDRNVSLGQRAGQDYRNELERRSGIDIANEESRATGTMRTNDTAFDRTAAWRNDANQANLLERALQTQDWETAANLLREQNGEELTALDVRNLVYDRGQDWVQQNLGRRDAGVANVAGIYQREGNQANSNASTSQRFGAAAANSYDTTREQEAGRGNWGTRAITGALTPLLGGGMVGGALGIGTPATPGSGGGGGTSGAGGTQGPGSFQWQGTQAQANPYSQYFSQLFNRNRQQGQQFNPFDPRTGAAIVGGI